MQARKEEKGWWLVLEKGEELKSIIEQWARKEGIDGASITGIGALTDAELTAYNPVKNEVMRRRFDDYYELVGLSGNLSAEGLHAHVILAGRDFTAVGGHLVSAKVSVLVECFVVPTDALLKVPLSGTPYKRTDLDAE